MTPPAAPARGLGKGLSALMNDSYTTSVQATASTDVPAQTAEGQGSGVTRLPLAQLQAGKYQPRRHFSDEALKELAQSIEKHGIMQPLVIRATGTPDLYEIIAGERRFRAAQLARQTDVPVIIRELGDAQALELALVENIQRRDLNPLEEAEGYQRLMDEFGYTQEVLAAVVGKSRSHVANLLRLQALPEHIKKMIDSGDLTMGHARVLLSAKQPEELAKKIIQVGMSVRQAEEWLKQERDGIAPNLPSKPSKPVAEEGDDFTSAATRGKSNDVLQIEQMLTDNLGLRVSINTRNNAAGEVVIGYDSLNQLDEILRRLGGSL